MGKKLTAFELGAVFLMGATSLYAQVPTVQQQVAEVLSVLPEEDRAGATVLGYEAPNAELSVIREGDGTFVCLADTPGDFDLRVSCYHRDLEPFMARGRELAAQGIPPGERRRIRGEEIATGALHMPDHALLVTAMGPRNEGTGVPDSVTVLRVLYMPFATPANTGLPGRPVGEGVAWIMDPGLHRAHVMMPPQRTVFELVEVLRR